MKETIKRTLRESFDSVKLPNTLEAGQQYSDFSKVQDIIAFYNDGRIIAINEGDDIDINNIDYIVQNVAILNYNLIDEDGNGKEGFSNNYLFLYINKGDQWLTKEQLNRY